MKRSLLAALITTISLSTAPLVPPAQATTGIARCATSDGTTVYTDKACSMLGARDVPISGPLLTRIAHEEARFGNDDAASITAVMPAPARRSTSSGCARTPTQLAMDLRGSLALGDINRVAESYDWVGMSSRQANRTLDRLQELLGKPVVDSRYFDARIGESADGGVLVASNASGIGGSAGMLQLVLGEGSARSAIDFDVRQVKGCYFVKY